MCEGFAMLAPARHPEAALAKAALTTALAGAGLLGLLAFAAYAWHVYRLLVMKG
jgi:hypothetical protein